MGPKELLDVIKEYGVSGLAAGLLLAAAIAWVAGLLRKGGKLKDKKTALRREIAEKIPPVAKFITLLRATFLAPETAYAEIGEMAKDEKLRDTYTAGVMNNANEGIRALSGILKSEEKTHLLDAEEKYVIAVILENYKNAMLRFEEIRVNFSGQDLHDELLGLGVKLEQMEKDLSAQVALFRA